MLDRLARDAAAVFVLDAGGRILRENDPDRSPGPRLALFGCAAGNLAYVRHDVPPARATAVLDTVRDAVPWFDADRPPSCLDALIRQLAPVTTVEPSLIYALPRDAGAGGREVVRSGTAGGDALLARLAREGMPAHLVEAGFVGVADLWPPWCVVPDGGDIAALAFAARLGEAAAEVGIYTFPRWRGRGLAAIATTAWAAHPHLRGRELFYSCLAGNDASRRVVAKLALEPVGAGLRIT